MRPFASMAWPDGHLVTPSVPSGAASPVSAQTFAAVPDGFERLWTPHRLAYVRGERPTEDAGAGCPFCAAPIRADADGLIVHRGTSCYVVMNLFPYNPGHVLICPYRHVSLYVELTEPETLEFTALTKAAIAALDTASAPQGYQHVVPRWGGDANFLPIIGQTKALPALLEDVRAQLVAAWPTTPGSVPSA